MAAVPDAYKRRKVSPHMAQTERLTTPLVDECSEVYRELRAYFAQPVRQPAREQCLLERMGNVSLWMSMVDAQLSVGLSVFKVNGLRSSHVRRKLREFERDFAQEVVRD